LDDGESNEKDVDDDDDGDDEDCDGNGPVDIGHDDDIIVDDSFNDG